MRRRKKILQISELSRNVQGGRFQKTSLDVICGMSLFALFRIKKKIQITGTFVKLLHPEHGCGNQIISQRLVLLFFIAENFVDTKKQVF